LAKAKARDEHERFVDLAGLDFVPLDLIAGIIDFDSFAGRELARREARLAVLRELTIELLPKVRVRDEGSRSLLSDKFHRVSETEFVDDYRIHDLCSYVCKVLDVSGCQRRTAGDNYSGDLRVGQRRQFERLPASTAGQQRWAETRFE
jgi:hypothetical protein